MRESDRSLSPDARPRGRSRSRERSSRQRVRDFPPTRFVTPPTHLGYDGGGVEARKGSVQAERPHKASRIMSEEERALLRAQGRKNAQANVHDPDDWRPHERGVPPMHRPPRGPMGGIMMSHEGGRDLPPRMRRSEPAPRRSPPGGWRDDHRGGRDHGMHQDGPPPFLREFDRDWDHGGGRDMRWGLERGGGRMGPVHGGGRRNHGMDGYGREAMEVFGRGGDGANGREGPHMMPRPGWRRDNRPPPIPPDKLPVVRGMEDCMFIGPGSPMPMLHMDLLQEALTCNKILTLMEESDYRMPLEEADAIIRGGHSQRPEGYAYRRGGEGRGGSHPERHHWSGRGGGGRDGGYERRESRRT
mmetsp:Transcript_36843/g.69314  ORF Transcript_36843/g.69314 Transcript_36843/m.69314 type:complete len:358 (-) Transcript_36843:333-1406(-)